MKTTTIYTVFLFLIYCFGMQAQTAGTINLNDESVVVRSQKAYDQLPASVKQAKFYRSFALNPLLQRKDNVKTGDIIDLQLFDNLRLTAKITKIDTDVNGTLGIVLDLPDYPMAFGCITTSKEGRSLFKLNIPELGRIFSSQGSIYSNENYLIEIDKSKLPKESATDAIPAPQAIGAAFNQEKIIKTRASSAIEQINIRSLEPNDPARIDILIVYTPAAKEWADANHNGINNAMWFAVLDANKVIENQGDEDEFRFVYSELMVYTEA